MKLCNMDKHMHSRIPCTRYTSRQRISHTIPTPLFFNGTPRRTAQKKVTQRQIDSLWQAEALNPQNRSSTTRKVGKVKRGGARKLGTW